MSVYTWRLPLHIPVAVLFSLLILGVGTSISLYHFHETKILLEAANSELFHNLAEDARKTLIAANQAVRRTFILLTTSALADANDHAQRILSLPEMTDLLDADPLIDSIMVGYVNGDFMLVRRANVADEGIQDRVRSARQTAWVVLESRPAGTGDGSAGMLLHRFGSNLDSIGVTAQEGVSFEPRLSDWYRRAAASNALIVTEPYAFEHSGERGVTFARRNGASVFGVNVAFDALARILAEKSVTPSMQIKLLGSNGAVYVNPDNSYPRKNREDSESAIRQALGLPSDAAVLNRIVSDTAGQPWHVSTAAMPGFGPDAWRLVLALPSDEIFAEAYRQRQRSILFTVIAVILSFPLAWLLSRLLTKPLHRLADRARELSALQFQSREEPRSVILEVDQLACAMRTMRKAITRFLEMGHNLGSARELDTILQQVEAGAREVSGAPWAAVRAGEKLSTSTAQPWFLQPDQAVRQSLEDHVGQLPEDLATQVSQVDGPVSLKLTGSRLVAWQLLCLPLRTQDGEVLGSLLLADRQGMGGLANTEVIGFLIALSGTAAVSLEKQRLIKGQKALLQGVVSMVADAIDARSPYTSGHCRRVTELAKRLTSAAHESQVGPLAGYRLNPSDREAVEIAALLHDCGKLTTPDYVIDKATKLDVMYNRIHEIRTRFEVLKRDAEIAYWKGVTEGEDEPTLRMARNAAWQVLDEEFAFVAGCNLGSENMPHEAMARLHRIASRRWQRTLDDQLGLSRAELARRASHPAAPLPAEEPVLRDMPWDILPRDNIDLYAPGNPWGFAMHPLTRLYHHGELHNLSVGHGTLTEEERFKIREHIVQTVIMLSRLSFPPDLSSVPEIACGHHETMNGTGYPRGLQGKDMSVAARSIAIADIFEALTAPDRPYKSPSSVADALELMRDMCQQNLIDADLFELFANRVVTGEKLRMGMI